MWNLTIVSFTLLVAACSSTQDIVDPIGVDSSLPTGTPESVGILDSYLEHVSLEIAANEQHRLHSMLVVRDGVLVFEEYYNGYGRDNPHDIRSATKSITSLLTGIAIDQSAVSDVTVPIMNYLGSAHPDVTDKGDILVSHLLTMSSGLDCDDSDASTAGQEDRMYLSKDWVAYFLALNRTYEPGAVTRYCTGGVVALGEAISQGAGEDFADFAHRELFGHLGIENYAWARYDDDRKVDTGGHLLLTPQAMAKIGILVLQGGLWNGQQTISTEWIEQSTRPHTEIDGVPYGYLWWSDVVQYGDKIVDVLYANGNGGQSIFIVPEFNLVSVFTAGYYNSPQSRIVFELFSGAVLPSLEELQVYLPNPITE